MPLHAAAVHAEPLAIDITGTPIEKLMNISVTTPGRRSESLREVPAAVFVLTAEDIRRARVTSIPEALRMIPGVEVAHIDANKWAVSIRGFNSRTANKLLVLIDGRSIYDPLYGGVFWEAGDIPLDNIERIEVIRGPGGTLWGANAVNGVINIITRQAGDTQGTRVSVGAGSQARRSIGMWQGWAPSDRLHMRVSADWHSVGTGYSPATAHDDARLGRAGFRVDWDPDYRNRWFVAGNVYDGTFGQTLSGGAGADSGETGHNLTLRWTGSGYDGSETTAQFWYSHTNLDDPNLGELRDTFDVELQRSLRVFDRHQVVWGLNARTSRDHIRDGPILGVLPHRRRDDLYSLFAQDTISMAEDTLRLTVGSKVEHNDYSGLELQPNVRLAWLADDRSTVWAAVSRAVRAPSRLESDVTSPILNGNHNFDSEKLLAYEAGYRREFPHAVYLDVTAYYNRYRELLSIDNGDIGNNMRGNSTGVEVSGRWQVRRDWQMLLAYSQLSMNLTVPANSGSVALAERLSGMDPRRQVSLRSQTQWSEHLEFEGDLRYVSPLRSVSVPDYAELDLGLGWHPRGDLELSVAAKNLLHSHHPEQSGTGATEIRRTVMAELQWRY